MRIKKFKITKEQKVYLMYQIKSAAGSWNKYSITCAEEAHPALYNALGSLTKYVVELCELPKNYISRIKVKGVSFSYGGENDTMGATIISTMSLENSNTSLNLITPHKIEAFYSGDSGDPKQLLPDECMDALHKLIQECDEYIKGHRAQGEPYFQKPQNQKHKEGL